MIEIGSQAPQFCIPNQDGIEICLRDLKGKWIVLYFYPKDDTPGCTKEACDFTAAMPEFEDMDAIILGVSPDKIEKHKKFIEKYDLNITLLSDESKEVIKEYDIWQLKKSFGKEYMGIVRGTVLIDPDGKIAHIWKNVKVRQKRKKQGETIEVLHSEIVKKKLQELQTA